MVAPPKPSYREMTDPENRAILSTINPKLWAAFQRSMARALELEIPEKEEMLLNSLLMTAGIDGRGREDLRDALRAAPAGMMPGLATMPAPSPAPGMGMTRSPAG